MVLLINFLYKISRTTIKETREKSTSHCLSLIPIYLIDIFFKIKNVLEKIDDQHILLIKFQPHKKPNLLMENKISPNFLLLRASTFLEITNCATLK